MLQASWLGDGAHVNAAGANSADRREVDADTVLRAAVRVTDQVAQAQVEAGEFRDLVAAGRLAWSDVHELGDLVTGRVRGRTSPSETDAVQIARHRAGGHRVRQADLPKGDRGEGGPADAWRSNVGAPFVGISTSAISRKFLN